MYRHSNIGMAIDVDVILDTFEPGTEANKGEESTGYDGGSLDV